MKDEDEKTKAKGDVRTCWGRDNTTEDSYWNAGGNKWGCMEPKNEPNKTKWL